MDRELSSNKPSGSVHGSPAGIESVSPTPVLPAARRWWKVAIPTAVLLGAGSGCRGLVSFRNAIHGVGNCPHRNREILYCLPLPSPPRSSERFLETQVELLHSPMVLYPLLSQPEISQQSEIRQAENPLDDYSEEPRGEGF